MSHDSQTTALAAVYAALTKAKEGKPRPIRDRPADERAAYNREAKRRERQKAKEAAAAGRPVDSDEAIRAALSDAAIMLLASGKPGSESIQAAVALAFPGRFAVSTTVKGRCVDGTLKPLFIKVQKETAR